MIASLEIDLGAMRRNVAALARLVAPAGYAAVVKADAYGHGLVPVARALAPDVAAFCVYRASEAAQLREAGIATPILVLGPVDASDLATVAACDAALTLWGDGAFARDAARAARRAGAPLAVHAKVDTGVTRLGLDADVASTTIATLAARPEFALRGIYTHLAAAEELESSFTAEQLARFERCLAPLAALIAERGIVRHVAASAAAMLFPRSRFDLIRAGIATYGIWPSEATEATMSASLTLDAALSWTTRTVVVREVDAGRSVGYGCSFVTARPSRIAVLPIGYAEGLPRALSNAGVALVRGCRVPLVGRVCMNMSFLDVTDVPAVATGDTVTLVGRDGDETIDANEVARAAGTIGYELIARLPAQIPRRYRAESSAIASAASIVPS
ncbi:MAG: alanine racemase [Vulcanimicrobiaceae bacterium]